MSATGAAGTGGTMVGTTGLGGVAGTAAGGDSGSAGGTAGADPASVDPDMALDDPATPGTGACATTTLGKVIARIKQTHPELSDINQLPRVGLPRDGTLILAFRIRDGFRAVFVRVSAGDCALAACAERELWYFQTDLTCTPQAWGHYHEAFDLEETCYEAEGTPLWSFPIPRIPRCGPDD